MSLDFSRRQFLGSATLAAAGAALGRTAQGAASGDDELAAWRQGVKISPVSKVDARHTMHTYYLLNPESPDGRRVVFYASTEANGHIGQIVVLDRETGKEKVLADDVHTEDAHRVALQQWTLGGTAVAYHEVRDKRWRVVVVDVETGSKKIVAEDRQLAFGRGDGHTLPLYGCHWNPGEHRGLYLYDLKTDQLREPCKITDVEQKYGAWLQKEFGGKPTSIAFPAISPDHKRVFFKMAAGGGGNEYMGKVSQRQGIVFFDLEKNQLTAMREKWGHPAWHPDSFHWIEMGNILMDADGGPMTRIPNVPVLRGQHLAMHPSGKLWVQDGTTELQGGAPGEWAVMVASVEGNQFEYVQKFIGNRGARSWRVNHPHPVFSADGKRLYYNINADGYSRLHVAEIA
jgi:Tol biopolymer transport system component